MHAWLLCLPYLCPRIFHGERHVCVTERRRTAATDSVSSLRFSNAFSALAFPAEEQISAALLISISISSSNIDGADTSRSGHDFFYVATFSCLSIGILIYRRDSYFS